MLSEIGDPQLNEWLNAAEGQNSGENCVAHYLRLKNRLGTEHETYREGMTVGDVIWDNIWRWNLNFIQVV
jgi:hypothetical protein